MGVKTGATVIGVEQRAELVNTARQNLPQVKFEVGDAFDVQKMQALASTLDPPKFAVVFIDISGNRDAGLVLRLIDTYNNTLSPKLVVVKAHQLKRLLLKAKLWIDHPLNNT